MKELLLGILFIVALGIGGLVYRNAVEHPLQPIVCPLDAQMCPDGTSVARTGLSCTFPACPPPNVSIADANVAFAVPAGFTSGELLDAASIATYEASTTSATSTAEILIRRYVVDASSTPLEVIQRTAVSGPSGSPVSMASLTSIRLNERRFTVASLERVEGVIDTAYYLARGTDVLRFDAIDSGIPNWNDPNLDVSTLPAHVALTKLLATLQVLQ